MQVERAVVTTDHTRTVLGAPPQSNLPPSPALSAEWAVPTLGPQGRRCAGCCGGREAARGCGEGSDISEPRKRVGAPEKEIVGSRRITARLKDAQQI